MPNRIHSVFCIMISILVWSSMSVAPARAELLLSLPTPPNEPWQIIQGYGCGTHTGWEHYSLDMTRVSGETRGAPVHAAADGVIWAWVEASGSLLVAHDNGLYTMYTHLENAVTIERGAKVARGVRLGMVGDRGTRGFPHLHFTAFMQNEGARETRRSIPLTFIDGYSLPEIGGCNQHGGVIVVAQDTPSGAVQLHVPLVPSSRYVDITRKPVTKPPPDQLMRIFCQRLRDRQPEAMETVVEARRYQRAALCWDFYR